MPERILLRNTRIYDHDGPHHGKQADISLKNGKIESISEPNSAKKEDYTHVIENACVSQGWVDVRAYLTDPGYEWKENVNSLAQAAAAGGFTDVVCHSETSPAIDKADLIEALRYRTAQNPTQLRITGCVSVGRHGEELAELYDMHAGGAVGFSDGLHPVSNSGLVLRAIQYLAPFNGLLMLLPMDLGLAGAAQVGEGKVSTEMGMKGIPALAEVIQIERDLKLLNYFHPDSRIHIGPITTAGAVEVIRAAKKRFPNLTADTSVMYLCCDDNALTGFEPDHKVWPPLRTAKDRKAVLKAVLDGTIDAVSSGHHPQAKEDKVNDFSSADYGAATLEHAFSVALQATGEKNGDSLIRAFTEGPRKVLGETAPSLEAGAKVSLTVFRTEGESTIPSKLNFSKAYNHSLSGKAAQGTVLGIYTAGKWVENPS